MRPPALPDHSLPAAIAVGLGIYLLLSEISAQSIPVPFDLPATAEVPADPPPSEAAPPEAIARYNWGGFIRLGTRLLEIPEESVAGADTSDLMLSHFGAVHIGGSSRGGPFRLEGSGELDIVFSNQADLSLFSLVWDQTLRNRPLGADQSTLGQDYLLGYSLHRLSAQFRSEPLIVKIGRQAISWGQGRFLDPLNLVTPIDPFALDLESIPGADAIDAILYLNDTDYLEAVIAPYQRLDNRDPRRLRSQDSNLLLRYQSTWENADIAFLLGHHFHSYVSGGEVSLAVWKANARFAYLGRKDLPGKNWLSATEGTESVNGGEGDGRESMGENAGEELGEPEELEEMDGRESHQFVTGVSYLFFGQLSFNAEMFWNVTEDREQLFSYAAYEAETRSQLEDPLPEDRAFFLTEGRIIARQPLLAQFSLAYDLTDLLTGSLFLIYDPKGGSSASLLQLEYSLSDESLLTSALHLITDGEAGAQFSGQAASFYLFVRRHF